MASSNYTSPQKNKNRSKPHFVQKPSSPKDENCQKHNRIPIEVNVQPRCAIEHAKCQCSPILNQKLFAQTFHGSITSSIKLKLSKTLQRGGCLSFGSQTLFDVNIQELPIINNKRKSPVRMRKKSRLMSGISMKSQPIIDLASESKQTDNINVPLQH